MKNLARIFYCFLLLIQTNAWGNEYINFVTCPIVRDVGPSVDACFFSLYQGETYHLNPVGVIDWGKPQLKHRLLVEGEVTNDAEFCGGKQFHGRITVLPELDLSCNKYMPFQESIVGKPRSDKRADNPAYGDMFAAMRADPSVSIQAVPLGVPMEAAIKEMSSSDDRAFTIYFPYNRDRIDGVTAGKLLAFIDPERVAFDRVEIHSYQAQTLLDSGERLSEKEGMALQRAEKLARILSGLGISKEKLDVFTYDENITGKGRHDWKNRHIKLVLQ